MLNWIISILSCCLLVNGSSARNMVPCRVVTQITVQWTEDGEAFEKTYTQQRKMDRLLLYLRALEAKTGSALPDAAMLPDCSLCLVRSDGSVTLYRLQGIQYFQNNTGAWKVADSEAALRIRLFTAATSSDTKN